MCVCHRGADIHRRHTGLIVVPAHMIFGAGMLGRVPLLTMDTMPEMACGKDCVAHANPDSELQCLAQRVSNEFVQRRFSFIR